MKRLLLALLTVSLLAQSALASYTPPKKGGPGSTSGSGTRIV